MSPAQPQMRMAIDWGSSELWRIWAKKHLAAADYVTESFGGHDAEPGL